MQEHDSESTNNITENDDLLMQEVIGGESDLFFLDAYLQDILQRR